MKAFTNGKFTARNVSIHVSAMTAGLASCAGHAVGRTPVFHKYSLKSNKLVTISINVPVHEAVYQVSSLVTAPTASGEKETHSSQLGKRANRCYVRTTEKLFEQRQGHRIIIDGCQQ